MSEKFKEFTISLGTGDMFIHVIEYAAYEQLRAKVDELEMLKESYYQDGLTVRKHLKKVIEAERAKVAELENLNKELAEQDAGHVDEQRQILKKLFEKDEVIKKLRAALDGIMSIGKRDTTNSKYDIYFETARQVLAEVEK